MLGLGQYTPIKSFREAALIRDDYRKRLANSDISDRRKAVRICSIDDEKFSPQGNLASYGFNVVPLGDIPAIDAVAEYHIVLCDLMGVGVAFDKARQGVTIIEEIKRKYPAKIVVAYTGAAMSAGIAKQASQAADKILRKDRDIDEWRELLDNYIDEVLDPYKVWIKTRNKLTECEIPTSDMLYIEDSFVRDIESGNEKFENMKKLEKSNSINREAKNFISSLITSTIVTLIFA